MPSSLSNFPSFPPFFFLESKWPRGFVFRPLDLKLRTIGQMFCEIVVLLLFVLPLLHSSVITAAPSAFYGNVERDKLSSFSFHEFRSSFQCPAQLLRWLRLAPLWSPPTTTPRSGLLLSRAMFFWSLSSPNKLLPSSRAPCTRNSSLLPLSVLICPHSPLSGTAEQKSFPLTPGVQARSPQL